MVFYRTYRPQTINQLDSTQVRESLYAILAHNEIPHAFLFTGPKGLGKTSTARIVAKVVNCEKRQLTVNNLQLTKTSQKSPVKSQLSNIEPCNVCDQCVSITKGTSLDVLEIDAASNRGIDEIRDLREKLRLSPVSAKKKVYIIDEVHMLTTEAFNALLKTLEEPPPHVMFVLCTTESQKVPATILSRCMHIVFRKASQEELVRSFERIVKGEGLHVEKEALLAVAQLADGGFRDGAKILEELALTAKDKKITKDLVEKLFSVGNITISLADLLQFLEKKDAKGALSLVGGMVEQGVDIKYFIEQLLFALHSLLLQEAGVAHESIIEVKKVQLGLPEIKTLITLLTKAHAELRYAVMSQLPLELALVEYCLRDKREAISEKQKEIQEVATKPQGVKDKEFVRESSSNDDLLNQFIAAAKKENQTIAGLLRSCSITQKADTIVIVAQFPFHRERLEEKNAFTVLEKIAQEIIGKKVNLVVQLQEK